MSIKVFNITKDDVIGSYVSLGQSDYNYAINSIYPLINRFDAQRRFLDNKFYERLERDILKGCLMPTITIAFVEIGSDFKTAGDIQDYLFKNIDRGYVLDGIQRLNTLKRASEKANNLLDKDKEIFFNIIIADNKDKLLYRMITLNNGQKPMTPRHQIEILTQELFNFDGLKIKIQTEKEKSENPVKDSFSLGDISKGYVAFLTNSVHNENSKIIDEKMDQILVGKILDSDLSTFKIQFFDIIKLINKLSENNFIRTWLQVSNNFIGFCVGIKQSYETLNNVDNDIVFHALTTFDKAFLAINPSKVNVGKFRRDLSKYFIQNANETFYLDEEELIVIFSEITA